MHSNKEMEGDIMKMLAIELAHVGHNRQGKCDLTIELTW